LDPPQFFQGQESMMTNTHAIGAALPERSDVRRCAALLAATAIACGLATQASAQQFTVPFNANQYLLDQTNAYRQSKGVPKLTAKGPANKAANQYSLFLARTNLPKEGPNKTNEDVHNADGSNPIKRVAGNGGKSCGTWENVAHSAYSSTGNEKAAVDAAMNFWKNSPGHEENLRRQVNGIGLGIHGWKHGNEYWYKLVQVFTQCP
jgi:uncharacterized protein YkwD